MGSIYCITNLINNKQYIGKTTSSIQKRFKEHCRDSRKERCEKRPLYTAMNKYGVENFIIEELESIEDNTLLTSRETYWIEKLNTCGSKGYNATKGGDGSVIYDYNEIIELAKLGYTCKQIICKIGCCSDIVYKVVKESNIKLRYGRSRLIAQYDQNGNYIQTFFSATDAIKYLTDLGLCKIKKSHGGTSKITHCCEHKNLTAYGYKWEYLPEPI